MNDNKYYEVPEFSVVADMCAFSPDDSQGALEGRMAEIGAIIPEAIASCQMLENKIDHYKDAFANIVDGACPSDEFSNIDDPAERLAAIQSKMENTRHAWSHVRMRLHRLIQAHGDIRALLGFDPIFRVGP